MCHARCGKGWIQIWYRSGGWLGIAQDSRREPKRSESHTRESLASTECCLEAPTNCSAPCNQLHRLRARQGAEQGIALACPSRMHPHFMHSLHLALLFSPHSKTFQEATSAPQVTLGRAFQDYVKGPPLAEGCSNCSLCTPLEWHPSLKHIY